MDKIYVFRTTNQSLPTISFMRREDGGSVSLLNSRTSSALRQLYAGELPGAFFHISTGDHYTPIENPFGTK